LKAPSDPPDAGGDPPPDHAGGGPLPDHVDQVRAQWQRERPDLDTTPLAIVARVGRAAAYFDQSTNALLGRHGLSRSSWDVLASLRRAGMPYELSPTELYRGLMRTSGTMTNRLKRLQQLGLIERSPDPQDGRGLLVRLTEKGLSLVDRIAPAHLANERDLLRSLTPADLDTLEDILRRLLSDLERSQPAPPADSPTGAGVSSAPLRSGYARGHRPAPGGTNF
jgi:DNA-binding MarR family transcriptional regulator